VPGVSYGRCRVSVIGGSGGVSVIGVAGRSGRSGRSSCVPQYVSVVGVSVGAGARDGGRGGRACWRRSGAGCRCETGGSSDI
jgi:hypothetical protein